MLIIHNSINKRKMYFYINTFYLIPDCVCDKVLCHSNLNYLEGYLDAIFDTLV